MAMNLILALVFLLASSGQCADDREKRSDDPVPLEITVSRLTSDLQALEAKVTALTSNVERLQQQVGFTVSLNSEVSLPRGNLIHFDSLLFNQGGAYVTGSGHFIAPVSGVYYIYIKTETAPGHATGLEVFKEGDVILHIYAPSHDAHQTPFDAMVTELTQGQRVWVSTCCVDGLVRTSTHFGGFLIRPH